MTNFKITNLALKPKQWCFMVGEVLAPDIRRGQVRRPG